MDIQEVIASALATQGAKDEELGLSISTGNSKIGSIRNFSLLPYVTCGGCSDWCESSCYSPQSLVRYADTLSAWSRNTRLARKYCETPGAFAQAMLCEIGLRTQRFRVHISGDFFSPEYTREWATICKLRPNTIFWAYTRSWRIPAILHELEALRALPNVHLLASMDPSIDTLPPANWRIAWIEGDPRIRSHALVCPEQRKKIKNCRECGFCLRQIPRDLVLLKHGRAKHAK